MDMFRGWRTDEKTNIDLDTRDRGKKEVTWIRGIREVTEHKGLEEGDWEEREEWRQRIWAQEDA